ncbi:MAG TPA: nitroreductase family protein [Bacilli bacterium]|nr:MAG: Nitroreductase family protein [Tenericutes bacterium ADurb.BinA124]HNZ50183.1 nitroreductase family protein [Bacilli bacterium]HOH17735.1 nitroreductase family protein [Bacilli bacterium]HPN61399.1 nitroreductase family protein [Bacilli bacterium]HPX84390.1 nitroreductase family protein [Bacilli bacterium]
MKNQFINILKMRRSHYALDKKTTIADGEIVKLVEEAVYLTPSAFNSQSARAVVLFHKDHDRLWDIVTEELRKIVPEDRFAATDVKMQAFKKAYGTVLFFEDQSVVQNLQERFPLYRDVFPLWSNQSAGMLNLVVWTALAENGLGASLQHYNPIIDAEVTKAFNLPSNWKLIAQMPFGVPNGPLNEKTNIPIAERVKVFGK